MKNEMYDYLKDHNYISENKKWNRQSELSEDRAECIANKYHSLTKEMQRENERYKEVIDKLRKYLVDTIPSSFDVAEYSVARIKDLLKKVD